MVIVMVRKLICSSVIALLALASVFADALDEATQQAAIASAHPAATAAGRKILDAGGNAFDAAIAIAAALGVVEPYSSGFGGGGFFLLHRARDGHQSMVDAREVAPGAATQDMFLDADGEFVRDRALNGPLAAAIPGLPAGLVHLATHYGRLPLAASLGPAIALARTGFAVSPRYERMASLRQAVLAAERNAAATFLAAGTVPARGAVVKQADLANTLAALAERGRDGFYSGDVAARLVAGVRAGGGIWTLADLANYRVVERQPVVGRYHNIKIVSAPPPSSGGIVLLEALNILEAHDLESLDNATRRHVVIEAMRRAYRDRAQYLGDPEFVAVPVARLISKAYAAAIGADLDPRVATPSDNLPPIGNSQEGEDTTHFSVIDAEGNRVAGTLSINYPFGACYVPAGTGVLLNNEMDDFSAKPMVANAYGLVGVDANLIAPGKRPLSSMTPTFLEDADRIGIIGTPGGSRIISMVLLGMLEFAAGNPPEAWVSTPRYHHQYLPDLVQYESDGLDKQARADLESRGHRLRDVGRRYGNMQAVMRERHSGVADAASDPRGEGAAITFVPRAHARAAN